MAHVTIYTRPFCPYCSAAVGLLEEKGVEFTEVVANSDPQKRQEMLQRSGGRATYPQIFVGDRHIGGFAHQRRGLREGGGLRGRSAQLDQGGLQGGHAVSSGSSSPRRSSAIMSSQPPMCRSPTKICG